MKTLKQCQWHRSSDYIVKGKHTSNFLLIINFEQASNFWVHIENINTFEDKVRYIMHHVVVIYVTKIY